ncbi:uncharacterized protein KRP23_8647 [Phytophthora ramorum]|uniref:uncharacterized protein n=1 Tax=Phytophthora ramorum TaxID=164328 RepID=UPI0030A57FB4|nr:hypothetical protein KRP23_8647 [Phytophthora ramorum]
MPGGSSSECSTELEASSSAVSASAPDTEEQYEDDGFDEYSDSFESDNDAGCDGGSVSAAVSVSSRTELILLSVGTRVQAFWREENEWFDGTILHVEEGNERRYYVHYDDGEEQWEGPSSIRPLPASVTRTTEYDQQQQLLPLSKQTAAAITGRRAIVYWPDEAEWFNGTVSAAQVSPPALKIEYDDGDSRWEQEHSFNCILLQRAIMDPPEAPLPPSATSGLMTAVPPPPPERVLNARPYQQVISDHFQPVRIARPYRCAVEKHSESVIIPRRFSSLPGGKADCVTQTMMPSFFSESS